MPDEWSEYGSLAGIIGAIMAALMHVVRLWIDRGDQETRVLVSAVNARIATHESTCEEHRKLEAEQHANIKASLDMLIEQGKRRRNSDREDR